MARESKAALLRELNGKRVKLLWGLRTKSGNEFPQGAIVKVSGLWRSGVYLHDDRGQYIRIQLTHSPGRGLVNKPFMEIE